MRPSKYVCIALVGLLACASLVGCQEEKTPDFSGYQRIAELGTLECTFHNVAELYNDGTDMLFGINVGYKKAWFEYDGTVELGVDVSKVKIEGPDANNVVTISIPRAQVLGTPDADESSFSGIYADTGMFTSISAFDKTEAYKVAQSNMREAAESNEALLGQAKNRAKELLARYVMNVGKEQGQNYEVRFVDVE